MKADLHIHTNFSQDGLSSPKEIVQAALEKNIDCICITDHGEVKGAVEAMHFGFDKNILVIPGIEITSMIGDILGINVKKVIPNGLSGEETIREIRKQGGIAVFAHPFAWPIRLFNKNESNKILLSVDAIEVFNAFSFNFLNEKAFDFSNKHNIPFTAGSDAHKADFVGRGYIETKNIFSAEELLEEIQNKRVKYNGNTLNLQERQEGLNRRINHSIYEFTFKRKNNLTHYSKRVSFLLNLENIKSYWL